MCNKLWRSIFGNRNHTNQTKQGGCTSASPRDVLVHEPFAQFVAASMNFYPMAKQHIRGYTTTRGQPPPGHPRPRTLQCQTCLETQKSTGICYCREDRIHERLGCIDTGAYALRCCNGCWNLPRCNLLKAHSELFPSLHHTVIRYHPGANIIS